MTGIQKIPNLSYKYGFESASPNKLKLFLFSFYKSLIFDFLEILSAICFIYFCLNYLNNKSNFWAFLSFLVLFLILIVINSALNNNWTKRILVIFLETIGIFYFLFNIFNFKTILFLGLVFIVFRLWGEIQTNLEMKNSVEIKFFRSTKPVFFKSVSAIILILVSFYIVNISGVESFLPHDFFDILWKNVAIIYNRLYPDININSSINDFSKSIVLYKFKKNPDFKNLFLDEQEKVIQNGISEFNKQISNFLGKEKIDFNQEFKKTIYEFIFNVISNYYNNFQIYFVIFWGLIIFLILKSIFFALKPIFNIFLFIIFHSLIIFNIIQIYGETTTREVLSFSE
jgi:hypothetical protein